MLTNEQLKEIEERAASATPGPWQSYWVNRQGQRTARSVVSFRPADNPKVDIKIADCFSQKQMLGEINQLDCLANAEFMACARTDVPELIAEVRRLKKLLGEDGA